MTPFFGLLQAKQRYHIGLQIAETNRSPILQKTLPALLMKVMYLTHERCSQLDLSFMDCGVCHLCNFVEMIAVPLSKAGYSALRLFRHRFTSKPTNTY